jgi:hypothetical protein
MMYPGGDPQKVKEVRSLHHVLPFPGAKNHADLPPYSCVVETPGTSEHRFLCGRHYRSPPTRFGLDIRREPSGIHREEPKRG